MAFLKEDYEKNGLIVRLQLEYDDLKNKITKLNDFLGTEKFKNIDETQQILLQKQGHYMIQYLNMLELRIYNLGGTPFSLSDIEYVERNCNVD